MTGRHDNSSRLFDELLVVHVQSGDRRAAERLASRWHPRLLRTANRLLRNEDQALGAVQETWVSIMRGLHSLRDPARFAPWSFNILRRRCAERIALDARQRRFEADVQAELATHPNAGEAVEIKQAFDSLSIEQRLAAQLFFVEGLSLAEIAEVQDVPLGTAKTRLFHARRKLKAALTGESHEQCR